MKVWCVPVSYLGRSRFLGFHHEVPIVIKSAQNLNRGTPDKWSPHSEVRKWRYRLGELATVHDEAIVGDFLRRNYNHKSPLVEVENIVRVPFQCTFEESLRDLIILIFRQHIDTVGCGKLPNKMFKETFKYLFFNSFFD